MLVLGLDTATWVASVGLVNDREVVAEESVCVETGHTDIILSLVQRVLAAANVTLTQVEGIGISIGPGSFSGLRIGLSTAKGFAYALDQRLVGVSTLEALAMTLIGWEGEVCTVLDARRQEVYAALFSCNGQGQVQRLTADSVLSPAELMELLRSEAVTSRCVFIGDGAEVYAGLLRERYGDAVRILPSPSFYHTHHTHGAAVARLAFERLQAGKADNLQQLVPQYIRASDAERKRLLKHDTTPVRS